MTSYQDLKDKPKRFHSLTGYRPKNFLRSLPLFLSGVVETNTLDGERQKNGSKKIVSYPVLRINCVYFHLPSSDTRCAR